MVHDTALILLLGTALIAAGSLSLLAVAVVSPSLRGVGWLSAAFASGSLSSGLLLLRAPVSRVYLADLALLLCFGLLRLAVAQLNLDQRVRLWPNILPLVIQFVVDLAAQKGFLPPASRVVAIGLLVALQSCGTALALRPIMRDALRIPGLFFAWLLILFAGYNVFRSALVLTGSLSQGGRDLFELVSFSLYIAVALGFAFNFFWITTAKLNAEAEHTASTDPLTRVSNRRHFLKWCEKELLRSQRSHVPFSVLMIDLDHFKFINDNFGHQRGDEVLCAAVERMQDSIRGIDILCRWGGEEFAVLLPNATPEATGIVAERIRDNIHGMAVPLGAGGQDTPAGRRLTVSIGSATYRDLDDDVAAMLLRADRALYRAKSTGRNRVLLGA